MAPSATGGEMPRALRLWVAGVTVLAVLGVVAVAGDVDTSVLAQPLAAVTALAVAVAAVFTVWDVGRPRSMTITVSELFIGFALVVFEPAVALVVCAVGNIATPPLRATIGPLRGVPPRSPLVLVHAVAHPVLLDVAAVVVVVGARGRVGLGWAALAGILARVLLDAVATGVIVHLDTGLPFRRAMATDPAIEYGVPLAVGAFGVALGIALRGQSLAWVVVLALMAGVVGLSHAGTRWSRERRRSRVLLDVAQSAPTTTGDEDIAQAVATRVAEALHVRRAAVVDRQPEWAELAVPVGAHGWLAVAERAIPTQAQFDRRDRELLEEVATVAAVVLDNGALLARLADAERMRSTLLAAAAHDLRNPLSTTEGALQAMRDAASMSEAVRDQLLGVATRATRRAGRLVHDLIVLEQQYVTAGEGGASQADVAAIADAVVAALPPEQATRCSLDLRDVPLAAMSPVLLERVVDNLVGNALKHTPDRGPVRVRVHRSGDRVEIAVDDRGPGIPAAQRSRILAPFERSVTTAAGYGLGLHIATEFVRRAGGELDITDRADGPGASFQVRLPLAPG